MHLSVFYEKLVEVVCGVYLWRLAFDTICVRLSIYLFSI